jgi:hypothetical protein
MKPTQLTHGQVVRGFGFSPNTNLIQVRTVRGFAADNGEAPETAYANCRKLGHATAWTSQQPSVLTDYYAGKMKELAEERQAIRESVILDDGQLVIIEGETFKVRLAGDQFCDPIHFKRIA